MIETTYSYKAPIFSIPRPANRNTIPAGSRTRQVSSELGQTFSQLEDLGRDTLRMSKEAMVRAKKIK